MSRDPALLAEVLKRALSRGAEYGDLFVEERISLRLRLEGGRLDPPVWGYDAGAGIRLIHTGITQYVYTDDLGEEGLMGAVDAMLRGSVPAGRGDYVPASKREAQPGPWPDAVVAIGWLRAAEEAARRADPAVFQAVAQFTTFRQRVQILTSRQPHVEETRTNPALTVRAFARRGDRTAEGTNGRGGPSTQLDETEAAELGREAAAVAVRMLDARPAEPGERTVILGSGLGGMFLHETCGHGIEADFVQRGLSYLAGRRGHRVAAAGITVVDDPRVSGARGSYRLDDEGVAGRRNVLIEQGVLTGYLYDVRTSDREGVPSTGNGRRQSYRSLPLPRMSNTFMEAGPYDPREILQNTRSGLFVAGLGGGGVDLGSGGFLFSVTEAYQIEGGKLGRPVAGATLAGRASDVLREVDMVGTDLRFDPGYGSCAKQGQVVPAGVGQPTVRLPRLLVGGTGS